MREIRSDDWQRFCQRLNEVENGATITVDTVDHNGRRTRVIADAPFQEMNFGQTDACTDGIVILAKNRRDARHMIAEPLHVRLEETENGAAFNPLLIEGEEGTTIITFHPVIRTNWLEGIRLD